MYKGLLWCTRWACGVLIFEMAAGYPPFYHEDRVTMFKNICQVKYTCPPHFSKVSFHIHTIALFLPVLKLLLLLLRLLMLMRLNCASAPYLSLLLPECPAVAAVAAAQLDVMTCSSPLLSLSSYCCVYIHAAAAYAFCPSHYHLLTVSVSDAPRVEPKVITHTHG